MAVADVHVQETSASFLQDDKRRLVLVGFQQPDILVVEVGLHAQEISAAFLQDDKRRLVFVDFQRPEILVVEAGLHEQELSAVLRLLYAADGGVT